MIFDLNEPLPKTGALIIATDGCVSGHFKKGERGVGWAGCGFVITVDDWPYVYARKSLGQGTISEAEYQAVIECLQFVRDNNLSKRDIHIFSDSQFMVRQLNGEYAVRAENIIPLYTFTRALLDGLDNCKIFYHSRETKLAKIVDKLIHKDK